MLAKLKSSKIKLQYLQSGVAGMGAPKSLQGAQIKHLIKLQTSIAASMFSSPHSRVLMGFSLVSFDNSVIGLVASQRLNWSSPA